MTLKKVAKLANEPALHFFDLAQALAELHATNVEALARLPAVSGISRRRMFYLLRVGQLIGRHSIERSMAEKVGWTKLKTIARHISKTGEISDAALNGYLDLAIHTRASDLAEVLRGDDVPQRRAVQFQLNSRARAELRNTLIAYGAKTTRRGLVGKEKALTQIVRAAMKHQN